RQGAYELGCSEPTLNILDKVIALTNMLEGKAKVGDLKINYLNQFQANIEGILSNLFFRGHKDTNFIPQQDQNWKDSIKLQIETNSGNISIQYHQIEFNIDFFDKIGYFNNNVVAIGANGSGKTTLSNKFKNYLQNNGVVISAQRILLVPNFDAIFNPTTTANELKQTQV